MATRLARPPLREAFTEVLSSAESALLLVSPYIGKEPLTQVANATQARNIGVTLMFAANPANALGGSVDLSAVAMLMHSTNAECHHVARLHAKVYAADSKLALITSANLTSSGLDRNEEFGVLVDSEREVLDILEHFEILRRTAVLLDKPVVQGLAELADLHRSAFAAAERRASEGFFREARGLIATYEDRIRHARSESGSTSAVFAAAVLETLITQGPSTTPEIHMAVQEILPDLCDDGIDRVINGVHFGKKWKHFVRIGQQSLKRQGAIELRPDGRWHQTPVSM